MKNAYLMVSAAELKVRHPRAGLLWVSPTYVQIKNGWALDPLGGVEVLHSQSGQFGANFMGYTGTVSNSTGSGNTLGIGFMYENTLGGVTGRGFGTTLPDVALDFFGLFADSTRDLPAGSNLQNNLTQFKWGTSLTLQTLTWLALMLRFDQVNNAVPQLHDLGLAGNTFAMVTPRLMFSTHFLSSEVLYIQYSRYFFGDAYRTPQGAGLYIDGGPAENVVKVEATMSW